MQTENLNIFKETVPYFYIIRFTETCDELYGTRYCGVRYAKGCHPRDFLSNTGYKTSSKIVKQLIAKYGIESFDVEWICTNFEGLTPLEYEAQFQIDNNCCESTAWLNIRLQPLTFKGTAESIKRGVQTRKRDYYNRHGYVSNLQDPTQRGKIEQDRLQRTGYKSPAQNPAIKAKQAARRYALLYTYFCTYCNSAVIDAATLSQFHGDKCKHNPNHKQYQSTIALVELQNKYNEWHNGLKYVCICGLAVRTVTAFETHTKSCIDFPGHINHCKLNALGRYQCQYCNKQIKDKNGYRDKHGINCKCNNLRPKRTQVDLQATYKVDYVLDAYRCNCGFSTPLIGRFNKHAKTCIQHKLHPNYAVLLSDNTYQCPNCNVKMTSMVFYRDKHGINCTV